MTPEIVVAVRYSRADGVTVWREVRVTKSMYDKQPMAMFRANARRRATEAVNAVFGTKIEQA